MPRRTRLDFPTIDCLLAFESAARHCSFARAAEELDTAPPVVSRHVARLEARVSTRLFDRSRAGSRPTVAGERAHAGISAGLDAIREGILRARAVTGEGREVIACPPDVWQLPVLPLLDWARRSRPGGSNAADRVNGVRPSSTARPVPPRAEPEDRVR